MGPRMLQILDLRSEASRPEDAAISNLAEDTSNSVKWFAGDRPKSSPDLGIIAQLDISNPREDPVDVCSPVGWGPCGLDHATPPPPRTHAPSRFYEAGRGCGQGSRCQDCPQVSFSPFWVGRVLLDTMGLLR